VTEQIERMSATLEVKLIDGEDNTKIYTLAEGGTTYINAGNYVDDKSKIDTENRQGAIITKTYYVDISSDLQSGLEILSKIPGDRLSMCPNTISEVSDLIHNEDEVVKRNDYKNYDNVLTPNSIASDYYKSKGRYDLVPINLSASDIIDYQICSPNMYQSAQCKGQFIYSRFRNVSDTFDMYANTTDKTNDTAAFNPNANFVDSENIYTFKTDIETVEQFWEDRFNFYRPYGNGYDYYKDETDRKEILFKYIVEMYDILTGSTLSSFLYYTENDNVTYMWKNTSSSTTNIMTNKIPTSSGSNADLKIVGIYHIGKNGDFDIYQDQINGYTFSGYSSGVLKCKIDGKIEEFKLDKDNFKYVDDDNVTVEGALKMPKSSVIITDIEVVLNRLPKTYKKSPTALRSLYSDAKVLMRLSNLTNSSSGSIKQNTLQQSLIRANKIAARSAYDVKAVNSATLNQIEPKIQSAYGFADLGKIENLNIDDNLSMDDGSFVTTHKIGYEDVDRYRSGESSCDSYLFLSPLNHSEIQVNGDSNKSNVLIKSNESLRVPIIYQYRMEDYEGNIFGKVGYKSTDAVVKNAKFANIIGIDIWLNTLSDTPKQYDIVVYSTYNKDNSRTTGTITKKLN
jgi:hypothetical protein